MNHTCLCLPSRSWYSFTDPGGMEGWVDLGWLVGSLPCHFPSLPSISIISPSNYFSKHVSFLSFCLTFSLPLISAAFPPYFKQIPLFAMQCESPLRASAIMHVWRKFSPSEVFDRQLHAYRRPQKTEWQTARSTKPTVSFLARSVVSGFDVAFSTFANVWTNAVDTELWAGVRHFSTFINICKTS